MERNGWWKDRRRALCPRIGHGRQHGVGHAVQIEHLHDVRACIIEPLQRVTAANSVYIAVVQRGTDGRMPRGHHLVLTRQGFEGHVGGNWFNAEFIGDFLCRLIFLDAVSSHGIENIYRCKSAVRGKGNDVSGTTICDDLVGDAGISDVELQQSGPMR